MGITARGSSWQALVVHLGTRYRRQFPTRKEAEIWEAETKVRLLRGEAPELSERADANSDKPQTMAALRLYTLEHRWAKTKSESTASINSKEVVERIGPGVHPRTVGRLQIDKLVASMKRDGKAPATINRKLAALSTMLKVALQLEVIDRKPEFEFLPETTLRRFRFTPEIETRVFEYFRRTSDQDMADYVAVSLDTGGRQGEVLRLEFPDVSDCRYVRFFGRKSGRSMGVPMTDRVRAIFERRHAELTTPAEYHGRIFPNLDKDRVSHQWRRMRSALGLDSEEAFVPHILRHEFCSRLADRGVNATTIMQLADHSSLTTTQRYVNMSNVSLEQAISLLNVDKSTSEQMWHNEATESATL